VLVVCDIEPCDGIVVILYSLRTVVIIVVVDIRWCIVDSFWWYDCLLLFVVVIVAWWSCSIVVQNCYVLYCWCVVITLITILEKLLCCCIELQWRLIVLLFYCVIVWCCYCCCDDGMTLLIQLLLLIQLWCWLMLEDIVDLPIGIVVVVDCCWFLLLMWCIWNIVGSWWLLLSWSHCCCYLNWYGCWWNCCCVVQFVELRLLLWHLVFIGDWWFPDLILLLLIIIPFIEVLSIVVKTNIGELFRYSLLFWVVEYDTSDVVGGRCILLLLENCWWWWGDSIDGELFRWYCGIVLVLIHYWALRWFLFRWYCWHCWWWCWPVPWYCYCRLWLLLVVTADCCVIDIVVENCCWYWKIPHGDVLCFGDVIDYWLLLMILHCCCYCGLFLLIVIDYSVLYGVVETVDWWLILLPWFVVDVVVGDWLLLLLVNCVGEPVFYCLNLFRYCDLLLFIVDVVVEYCWWSIWH